MIPEGIYRVQVTRVLIEDPGKERVPRARIRLRVEKGVYAGAETTQIQEISQRGAERLKEFLSCSGCSIPAPIEGVYYPIVLQKHLNEMVTRSLYVLHQLRDGFSVFLPISYQEAKRRGEHLREQLELADL
jgi:hypothetical protein